MTCHSKFKPGFRHERLVIIETAPRTSWGGLSWLCQCDCGNKTVVSNIMNTKSCGCAYKWKHGMTNSPEYQTWKHMLSRCNNPKATKYYNYGGRGIKVCKRWHTFEKFFQDMGNRPEGFTLDRIDTNKNYSKSNCKWSNAHDQNRNKRTNKYVYWNGKSWCISDLAKEYNIACGTLGNRINRGWSVDKALNDPINTRHRRKKC